VITILSETFQPKSEVPDVSINVTHLFNPLNVINGQVISALEDMKLIDSKSFRYEMEEEDPSGLSYLTTFLRIDSNPAERKMLGQRVKFETSGL
jgi:hypothetical protein